MKKDVILKVSVVVNVILIVMVLNLKIAAVNNKAIADYFSQVCDYKQDHLMEVVVDYQKMSERISSLNADVIFYKSQLRSAENKIETYETLFANYFSYNVEEDDEDGLLAPSVTPSIKEKELDKGVAKPSVTPCPTKKVTPTPTLAPVPQVPASTLSMEDTTQKTERLCPTFYGVR